MLLSVLNVDYTFFSLQREESSFPQSLKRRAIDALHMKTRAAEEKVMLRQEMKTLVHHLQQQHAFLHSAITDTKHPGCKAVLVGSIIRLERKLYNATLMFQQHIPNIHPLPHPYLPQLNSLSNDLMSPDVYTLLNDGDVDVDDDNIDDDDEDDDDDDDSGDSTEGSVHN